MHFGRFWGILMAAILFAACEKEEALYPRPNAPVGLQTQTFAMGENYENQLWFDFETQKMVSNKFGMWDIGVACNGEPSFIICNGKNSNFAVAKLENIDFFDVTTSHLQNLVFKNDHPNGSIDSSAFGHCFEPGLGGYIGKNWVFILDRGNDSFKDERYVKIAPVQASGGIYQFKWGFVKVPGSGFLTQITTKPEFNYSYYSFSTMDTVQNEPLKSKDWDIVFTTYKERIPDKNGLLYNYIIRGALHNLTDIDVCQIDQSISFDACTKEFAKAQTYSHNADEIGYDWKEYNSTTGKYTIVPIRFYIIKTSGEQYFKVRFVDFYDDQGRKGFPKMAWQLLN